MHGKHIGIWGFGAVGKSALTYFAQHGIACQIFDQRMLSQDEHALLLAHNATSIAQESFDTFLSQNDYILASPGIDINPYKTLANFICELDLFTLAWKKQLIAVTGAVGKTSTVTLLDTLLQQSMRIAVGGNIGVPMLNLLEQQNESEYALLELSSWQLEHAHPFSPDIAILTNVYPNHLDRHKTMDAYFKAKLPILAHQTSAQTALLPLSLYDQITPLNLISRKIWINDTQHIDVPKCMNNEQLISIENGNVVIKHKEVTNILGSASSLPRTIYTHNALCAAAVLHTLNMPFELIANTAISIEHRLEKIKTDSHITFYNDSKATTIASTLAAVEQFKDQQIILFLGGLSKGVNRAELIHSLPTYVSAIMCFGQEAETLHAFCKATGFTSTAFKALEPAFAYAVSHASANDILLFSPAGASYDLYTDYAERGRHFKRLVADFIND